MNVDWLSPLLCLSLRRWDLSGTSSCMSLSAYLQLHWGILKSKVRMRMDIMSPLGLDGMRSQHMPVQSRIWLLLPEKPVRNICAALLLIHFRSHLHGFSLFCFLNFSLTFTLNLLLIKKKKICVCACCFNQAAGWNPRWELEVASV